MTVRLRKQHRPEEEPRKSGVSPNAHLLLPSGSCGRIRSALIELQSSVRGNRFRVEAVIWAYEFRNLATGRQGDGARCGRLRQAAAARRRRRPVSSKCGIGFRLAEWPLWVIRGLSLGSGAI